MACQNNFFYRMLFILALIAPQKVLPEEDFCQENNFQKLALFDFDDSVNNSPSPSSLASNIAILDGEPSSTVGQGINVISGAYCEGATDIVTTGANPIALTRTYCSSQSERGTFHDAWNLAHCDMLKVPSSMGEDPDDPRSYLTEGSGSIFFLKNKKEGKGLHEKTLKMGLTNTSSGNISGQTNQKNLDVKKFSKKVFQVTDGAEMHRFFTRTDDDCYDLYRLDERVHPSGNYFKYSYHNHARNFLHYIHGYNTEKKLTGWIRLDHSGKEDFQLNPVVMAYCSDNIHVSYIFSLGYRHNILHCVNPSHGVPTYYSYWPNKKLKRKAGPDDRFVETHYYKKGKNYVGHKEVDLKGNDPSIGRVCMQKAPVGTTNEPIITHKIFYNYDTDSDEEAAQLSKSGSATVWNALGNASRYYWDKYQRLKEIVIFDENREIYRREKFFWGKKSDAGNLVRKEVLDGEGKVILQKDLSYDYDGNVLGDKQICDLPQEYHQKSTSFNYNAYNLISFEQINNQIVIYEYYEGSNLVSAKFILDLHKNVKQRFFYDYDENGLPFYEIVDDGCTKDPFSLEGVTQRRMRHTVRKNVFPIGLPVIIREFYADLATDTKVLLKTTVNQYSREGKLLCQKVDGSDGQFCHMSSWEYDGKGNMVAYTDPLGQKTLYRYDNNKNLIWEQGPDLRSHNEYEYDFSNRKISSTVVHASGARLTNCFGYDLLSQKTSAIDIYGNATYYEYDFLGRQKKITFPLAYDENGSPTLPQQTFEYDILNHVTKSTDGKGNATYLTPNFEGNPLIISYADGSYEAFTYNLDGKLSNHYSKDGVQTLFTYDYQNRPLTKKELDTNGKSISFVKYTYSAFNLLEEKHSSGKVIRYKYDEAGRLVEKNSNGQITTYFYDTLSRCYRTNSYYGDLSQQFIAVIQKFDALNRVVEERTEDGSGELQSHIFYEYDSGGNKIAITTVNFCGISKEKIAYTPTGEACHWIDPNGIASWKSIYYDHFNALGQRVRYEEITDGAGLTSCYEYDALGRVSIITQRALWGGIVSKTEKFYDGNGNLCQQVDSNIDPNDGSLITSHKTLRTYDTGNKLTSLCEAAFAPKQRLTKITYNKKGQKEAIIYPDGVALQFAYNSEGKLSQRFSSDGTINEVFQYDAFGNIIEATNLVTGRVGRRIYDEKGYLIKDQLSHGLDVRYAYDKLGRVIAVELPDQSAITYDFEGSQLRQMHRFLPGAHRRYSHTYNTYDYSGNLCKASLVGNAGEIFFKYDLLNRLTAIKTNFWEEAAGPFDGASNLLAKYTVEPLFENRGTVYQYDGLHHLVSEDKNGQVETYQFDSLHNRRKHNGAISAFNMQVNWFTMKMASINMMRGAILSRTIATVLLQAIVMTL